MSVVATPVYFKSGMSELTFCSTLQFRGAKFEDVKRDNVIDLLCYGFWYRTRYFDVHITTLVFIVILFCIFGLNYGIHLSSKYLPWHLQLKIMLHILLSAFLSFTKFIEESC